MKKRFTLLLSALLVMTIIYTPADAFEKPASFCECTKRYDFEREFEISDAVFVGEVVEIEKSQPDAVITFKVERLWKGAKTGKLLIFSDNRGKACGYLFKKGERYLVYAANRNGKLHTDICSRTATADAAAADVEKLNEIK